MKYKYQVVIDYSPEEGENEAILDGPLFDTLEEADAWYRSLKIYNAPSCPVDFIMVMKNESGMIEDTWLI